MSAKQLFLYVVAMIVGNVAVWFQLYGRYVFKGIERNQSLMILMGLPITFIFMQATKLGYAGFNGLAWPIKISGFAIGMIVFSVMTGHYLQEVPDVKTIISLLLCVLVIVIQFAF